MSVKRSYFGYRFLMVQPFTDYTVEDFKSLVSTNLEGFLYVTELFRSRRQSLSRK